MPAKNTIKTYAENSYYHIYNRGVEKRLIFMDQEDCIVFLRYLKLYLSPPEELLKQPNIVKRLDRFILKNISQDITLLCFTLMPNHLHLLVKQNTVNGIIKLMRRLSTSYVMYFNKKYQRVGALFQNTYKASLVTNDSYLLHLSRYIHLNPREINFRETKYKINFLELSSYPYYLGKKNESWIKPQEILDYFNNNQSKEFNNHFSYKNFVEDYKEDARGVLGELTLED